MKQKMSNCTAWSTPIIYRIAVNNNTFRCTVGNLLTMVSLLQLKGWNTVAAGVVIAARYSSDSIVDA